MNNNDSTGHGIDGTPTTPQYGVDPRDYDPGKCPYDPFVRTNAAYFTGSASSGYAESAQEGYTDFTGSGHSETIGSPAQNMENGFGAVDLFNSTAGNNQAAIQGAVNSIIPGLLPGQVSGEIHYTEQSKFSTCITGVAIDNSSQFPAVIHSAGINLPNAAVQFNLAELSIGGPVALPNSNSPIVHIQPFCFNPYQAHDTWINTYNSEGQGAYVHTDEPKYP